MGSVFNILRDRKTALEIDRRIDDKFAVKFSKDGTTWQHSIVLNSTSEIEPWLASKISSSKRISPT